MRFSVYLVLLCGIVMTSVIIGMALAFLSMPETCRM